MEFDRRKMTMDKGFVLEKANIAITQSGARYIGTARILAKLSNVPNKRQSVAELQIDAYSYSATKSNQPWSSPSINTQAPALLCWQPSICYGRGKDIYKWN
jgi:hypothetical protein